MTFDVAGLVAGTEDEVAASELPCEVDDEVAATELACEVDDDMTACGVEVAGVLG